MGKNSLGGWGVGAEMRMADAIDEGQANGKVESVGGDRKSEISVQGSDNDRASYESLGIDRHRVALAVAEAALKVSACCNRQGGLAGTVSQSIFASVT